MRHWYWAGATDMRYASLTICVNQSHMARERACAARSLFLSIRARAPDGALGEARCAGASGQRTPPQAESAAPRKQFTTLLAP